MSDEARAVNPSITDRLDAYLQAEEAPEAAPDAAPEPEAIEAADEDAPPVEMGLAPSEPLVSDEGAPPAEAAAEEESVEEVAVTAFNDLAEHFGTDLPSLYSLTLTTGNGEEVSVETLKDNYKAQQVLDTLRAEIQQERQSWQQERVAAQQDIEHKIREAGALALSSEEALRNEYQSVDWNTLRVEQPEEWAARREEFRERQARIEESKRSVLQQANTLTEGQRAELQSRQAEVIARESAALLEKFPEWRDEEKAASGKKAIVDYLTNQGFDPNTVYNIADHKAITLAHKAMLYDQQVKQGQAAAKKLVKIGSGKRVMRPGPKQSASDVAQERADTVRQRHHRTGTVNSAAEAIHALLNKG